MYQTGRQFRFGNEFDSTALPAFSSRTMPTAFERREDFSAAITRRRQDMKKGPALWALALSVMVRLAGFEPTTPWFVAKYSIQLSYSRISPKL